MFCNCFRVALSWAFVFCSQNSAGSNGGAIHLSGCPTLTSSADEVTILSTIFEQNSAADRGGHISVLNRMKKFNISTSLFDRGKAEFGAALWLQNQGNDTHSVQLDDTTFHDNSAVMGGGCFASDVVLNFLCEGKCVYTNNSATYGPLHATIAAKVYADAPPVWPVNGDGFTITGTVLDGYGQVLQGAIVVLFSLYD